MEELSLSTEILTSKESEASRCSALSQRQAELFLLSLGCCFTFWCVCAAITLLSHGSSRIWSERTPGPCALLQRDQGRGSCLLRVKWLKTSIPVHFLLRFSLRCLQNVLWVLPRKIEIRCYVCDAHGKETLEKDITASNQWNKTHTIVNFPATLLGGRQCYGGPDSSTHGPCWGLSRCTVFTFFPQ